MITIVIVSDDTMEGKTTLARWLKDLFKSHGVSVKHLNKRNTMLGYSCCDYTDSPEKDIEIFPLEKDRLDIEIIDIDGGNGPSVRTFIGMEN